MPDVVICVVWQSLTCEVEVVVDVAVVIVNAGGVVIVTCCCWAVRWGWWVLRMLTCHTSTFQTKPITDPSPAQTGMEITGKFFRIHLCSHGTCPHIPMWELIPVSITMHGCRGQ